MRISDWSSDGCSADLGGEDVSEAWGRKFRPLLQSLGFSGKAGEVAKIPTAGVINSPLLVVVGLGAAKDVDAVAVRRAAGVVARSLTNAESVTLARPADRAEERRGGKEWDSRWRSRWWAKHIKK